MAAPQRRDKGPAGLDAAIAAHKAGRYDEAESGYRRVLARQPKHSAAAYYLGALLADRGAPNEAATWLARAAAGAPTSAAVLTKLAEARRNAGHYAAARTSAETALAAGAGAPARYSRAIAALTTGDGATAAADLDQLLAEQGAHPTLLLARGQAAMAQDAPDTAAMFLERAREQAPANPDIAVSLAQVRLKRREPERALAALEAVAEPGGARADWHLQRGRALRQIGSADGLAAFQQASGLAPADPRGPAEEANELFDLGRLSDAAERCQTALGRLDQFHPDDTGTRARLLAVLGHIRRSQARIGDAQALLAQSVQLDPTAEAPHSYLLLCLHYDVTQTEESLADAYRAWGRQHAAPLEAQATPPPAGPADKAPLVVGILAQRLKRHPQTWLYLAAYENLDPAQVQLIVYDSGTQADDMTARLRAVASAWRDIASLSDGEAAALIRRDGVDILIQKMAHPEGRLLVCAHRPAPVQVQWGGFNTTGMASMDWFLGDPIETPPPSDAHFTERVYRLPDDYTVYTPPRDVAPAVAPLPASRSGRVTFGCFNHPPKISAAVAALWRRILAAVPESRLLLKGAAFDDPESGPFLRRWLAEQDLPSDRLVLAGWSPHEELLASYNAVDIALDTWPYSGGVTTCEALWMGVPTVTLPGPSFVGRHAATHLSAAGLGDWIAADGEDYVAKACAWARAPDALATLRAELRDRVAASPLCDGPRFARHLETALARMWHDAVAASGSEARTGNG